MEKERFEVLNKFMQENKGKRKFSQSVELSVNFKGIDFSKQEERLNLEVQLPNGKGKEGKVIIFADDRNITESAKKMGVRVIGSSEIPSSANDKAMLRDMLKSELMAQPSLMPSIAKSLGQFLGPRNKMPKPLIGSNIENAIKSSINSVQIRSKGKYLPTIHCIVGKESMDVEKIAQNIDAVMSLLSKKPGNAHIKSAYVKLTMSNPVKIV
jgi:large subunit ribosomal protein L1